MFWFTAYIIFLVKSVLCSAAKISQRWREDKMDERQDPLYFSTKRPWWMIEQRRNQDNLNISVGIQSMLTSMYECGV
jgi:hypothetical protein